MNKPDLRPTRHYRVDDRAIASGTVATREPSLKKSRPSGRVSTIAALRDDWRSFAAEVRSSPASHALVAVLTVVLWTAVLVVPTLLGAF